MKNNLTLFFVFCLSTISIFSADIKIDWSSLDATENTYNFWLTDNATKAVAVTIVKDTLTIESKYYITQLNLTDRTFEILYEIGEKEMNGGIKFNPLGKEFFYFINDTFRIRSLSDFSFKSKIKLPYSIFNSWWYDEISNLYNLSRTSGDTLFILKISPELNKFTRTDTLLYPGSKRIYHNYSDNGAYMIVNDGDNNLYVYDVNPEMKLIASKTIDKFPNTISVSNSGKYIGVNTNYTDTIPFRVYDIENPENDFYIRNPIIETVYLKFNNSDSKILLSSSNNGQYVYEMNNPVPIKSIIATSFGRLMNFCLDDNYLISLSNRKMLTLESINGDEFVEFSLTSRFGKNFGLKSVRFEESNEKILVSGDEGIISARNVDNGQITHELRLSRTPISIMNSEYSEIKNELVYSTGIYSSRELVFLNGNLTIERNYSFPVMNIKPLTLSNDKKWFAASTYNAGTFLYNLDQEQNKKIFLLDSGRRWNEGAAFSSDSRYFACGGTGNIIKIYDLHNIYNDTTPVMVFDYKEGKQDGMGILYIKFIDNDTKLVTASNDVYKFKVWSLETGELLSQPAIPEEYADNGNFSPITYLVYRPKFDDYLTGDIFGVLILWDKNFNFKSINILNSTVISSTIAAYDYNPQLNKLVIGTTNSQILMLSLDNDTDINDTPAASEMLVSPNPATDFITINLQPSEGLKPSEGSDVEIYDMLGVKLISEPIHPMTPSHRMNVEKLPVGLYFVKIGNKVEKFVKM